MPSKQTKNDVIAIEELVNEIKLNLRLKAAPPSTGAAPDLHQHPLLQPPTNDYLQQPNKQYQSQQLITRKQRSRPSPYHIPCRSWSETSSTQKQKNLQKSRKNDENNIEDPYELLQSLLKNNSLVKEAVRRLQLNTSTYSRKQNYFYDSDEDNRSPIVMMCQLESLSKGAMTGSGSCVKVCENHNGSSQKLSSLGTSSHFSFQRIPKVNT